MELILFYTLLALGVGLFGALLMPNQGEVVTLEALVNKVAPQALRLKLYKNDVTPADANTESAFTEATFTGYTYIDLTTGSWTVTGGAPTEATFPQQTFTSSSNQTTENIYGYFVTQQTSGKLVWAERFTDAPYPITNNGDAIKITPKIQLKKQGE